MRTADLRIGNLVSYKNEDIVVADAVSKDFILTHGQFKISTPNIEPIPLTEQWLLDFGFEYKLRNEYAISIGDYTLLLSIEKDHIAVIYVYAYDSEATFLKNIIYVHQLQNLYFALFQEELIIK